MASKKKKLVPPPEIAEPERLGKSDQRLGAILNEEIISKQYDKATKKLDAWEKKTFKGSGALGEIPGWFPQNDVIRLSVVREWLARRWDEETRKFVKRYSLKDIMEMMVAFRKHKETNMPLTHYHSKSKTRNIAKPTLDPFPKEAYGPVSVVCHYDDTISAGPDEGLKMMVGNEAAKAILARNKSVKKGPEGIETIKQNRDERESDIIQVLSRIKSKSNKHRTDDQIIEDTVDHFKHKSHDQESPYGYKKSIIRSIFNKHIKGK